MNRIILLGRLVRDPDIKATNAGMIVCRFTLAVDRPRRKGQQEKETDFINCVAFGKTGEIIGDYVSKGQRLLVEGRLQTGNYTDKNGIKRYNADVFIDHSEFVEKRSESTTQGSYQSGAQNASTGGFERFGTVVNEPPEMEQGEIPF